MKRLNLKQYINDRKQVSSASLEDVFSLIKSEFGENSLKEFVSETSIPKILQKQTNDPLSFVFNYVNNPEFKKNILNAQKENLHKIMIEEAVKKVAGELAFKLQNLIPSDLNKSVEPKAWKKMTSKIDTKAPDTVDHSMHLQQFPAPQEYKSIHLDPAEHKNEQTLSQQGIAAKNVHLYRGYTDEGGSFVSTPQSESTFMSKPYHKKLETATRSFMKAPISGWSTMATKALYNAGGIGHLAEDVSMHEKDGHPFTIHKFAPNHHEVTSIDLKNNKTHVNPEELHKIGVMDYLMNNLDRHAGNLLVSKNKEEGFNKLLGIDHERNFQYIKTVGATNLDFATPDSPEAYLKHSYGTRNLYKDSARGWHSHENLADWWHNNGHKIKDKLEEQLGAIKDQPTREHIRDNFNHRWHNMNNWVKGLNDIDDSKMYSLDELGQGFPHTRVIRKPVQSISSAQLKSLPEDPTMALNAVSDIVHNKKKLTPKQKDLITGTVNGIIEKMNPDQAAQTFNSIIHNPHFNSETMKQNELNVRNMMLNHFADTHWVGDTPSKKLEHQSKIADVIDSLPKEKREILGHWSNLFRRNLAQKAG
jgi:hypothetical protein